MVSSAVEQQKEERRLRELEREQQEQEVVIRARQKARQAVERSRSESPFPCLGGLEPSLSAAQCPPSLPLPSPGFEQAQLQAIHERKRAVQRDLKQQMEEARAVSSS